MANKQYVKGTRREGERASKISTSSKNTKKHRATIPYETYRQQNDRGVREPRQHADKAEQKKKVEGRASNKAQQWSATQGQMDTTP